jgi:hypothetical protein
MFIVEQRRRSMVMDVIEATLAQQGRQGGRECR